MCTQTHDRRGTPARSSSRTSLSNVPATCVQDARIGYIQDILVFEKLRIIVEPMDGSVPLAGRYHSQAHLSHHLVHHVRQYVQHISVERQWHRQQTDGTHLPRGAQRQSGGHSRVQAHGTIEKSQHPELHPSTIGSTPRPRRGLTVFISVSFTRKPLSTTSKNDSHLEELTIIFAMDNTELLITNVYIPPASSCNGCYSPPLDHMLTGTYSLVL